MLYEYSLYITKAHIPEQLEKGAHMLKIHIALALKCVVHSQLLATLALAQQSTLHSMESPAWKPSRKGRSAVPPATLQSSAGGPQALYQLHADKFICTYNLIENVSCPVLCEINDLKDSTLSGAFLLIVMVSLY